MSIFHDGVLCDVHVRYWSGAKLLTPEDLGLTEEEVSKAFKLGKKELIPDNVMKQFRTIEGRARAEVALNSFPFPIGHANFLPKRRAEKVFQKLEDCKTEYNRLTEDLIQNYPAYKEAMRPIYQEAAETAYLTQTPTGVTEFSIEGREADKETYVRNFLARIEAHYPPAESLRSRFDLNWDVYTISLNAEQTTASNLLRNVSREKESQLSDLRTQAIVEAKQKLDIEAYKSQTESRIGGFVGEVVNALRSQTIQLCESVTANIKDGMVVTGRTYNRIKDFIDRFQDMNFVGDSVVEEQLGKLKKEFLDVFQTDQVREDPELQEELTRRLRFIAQAAAETTDVSEITGEYSRRVLFNKGSVSDNN